MTTPIDSSEFSCVRYYTPGDRIFREGERASTAFVVCEGTVEIYKGSVDKEVRLALCDAGSIFGEMALIDDSPRSATARSLTYSSCLVLSKERFRRFFNEADPFVRGLLRILVANVRETSNSMVLFHQVLSDLRRELDLPHADCQPPASSTRPGPL